MRTRLLFWIFGILFFLLGSGLVFDGGSAYAKHVTPSPQCEKSLEGGLVQCGRSCDDSKTEGIDEHAECGFCSLFSLFQKIVNWIVGVIAPLIALLLIVFGGFMLVTSRGDPKQTTFAKNTLIWTLIGYALILVSWVVVSSIFASIGVAKWTGLRGGWWQPVCGRTQVITPNPTPTLPALPPTEFVVQPYIVYPADKPVVLEYETAVNQLTPELRDWYKDKIGATFTVTAAKVATSPLGYVTLRCGTKPTSECLNNRSMVAPEAKEAIFVTTKSLAEKQPGTIVLVFGVGSGEVAGGFPVSNFGGYAFVGDWVLEPISGVKNEWGIPCSLAKQSEQSECEVNTAKGKVAHELGHALGLVNAFYQTGTDHPPTGSQTIMNHPWNYPTTGFLSEEIDFLRKSPFFK